MTVHVLHYPSQEATRHWGGNLPNPRTRIGGRPLTEGAMPEESYPIPDHARRLISALHAAGDPWELIVLEAEDTVTVRHHLPYEDPYRITWVWQCGRRTHGPAVRRVLDTLTDRHPA